MVITGWIAAYLAMGVLTILGVAYVDGVDGYEEKRGQPADDLLFMGVVAWPVLFLVGLFVFAGWGLRRGLRGALNRLARAGKRHHGGLLWIRRTLCAALLLVVVGCGGAAEPVPAADAGTQLGCLRHWEDSDGGVCIYGGWGGL